MRRTCIEFESANACCPIEAPSHWKEKLPPWIFEAWHFILARELGLPQQAPRWLIQPAAMAVPLSTPQAIERLGCFKDVLRPFTVITVPIPIKEIGQLWTAYFVMPHAGKMHDLHGRPMVNVASGATFYIYDQNSATLPKSLGWLALRTMEDEINHLLSRAESKFCTPNGGTCISKTIGLLVRRHIVAGEFHYVGKEASTRWTGGPDLSMLEGAGVLDSADENLPRVRAGGGSEVSRTNPARGKRIFYKASLT